jgi:hypothetical protein
MTHDDVIVSRHYFRRAARHQERTNPEGLRVVKAHRGPYRWYCVKRRGWDG